MVTVTTRNANVVVSAFESIEGGRQSMTDEVCASPAEALAMAESVIVSAVRLLPLSERQGRIDALLTNVSLRVFGARTFESDMIEGRG